MCERSKGYELDFVKERKTDKSRKTPIYTVRKEDARGVSRLGVIKFRGAWRQYVFYPDEGTYWNHECLDKIIAFMLDSNVAWREAHRRK